MNKVPDRWLPYSPIGQPIAGTRFIAFKVPLKDAICKNLKKDERFTPAMLLDKCPTIGLVIDLTNTQRYYDKRVFLSQGVQYQKIFCPGKVIPKESIVNQFIEIVDSFLGNGTDPDSLIGVHCTHGINRTAYFICSYMIQRMNFPAKEAITAFERARGHKIERAEYVQDLLGDLSKADTSRCSHHHHQHRHPYAAPSFYDRPYDDAHYRQHTDYNSFWANSHHQPFQGASGSVSQRDHYRTEHSQYSWSNPNRNNGLVHYSHNLGNLKEINFSGSRHHHMSFQGSRPS